MIDLLCEDILELELELGRSNVRPSKGRHNQVLHLTSRIYTHRKPQFFAYKCYI